MVLNIFFYHNEDMLWVLERTDGSFKFQQDIFEGNNKMNFLVEYFFFTKLLF